MGKGHTKWTKKAELNGESDQVVLVDELTYIVGSESRPSKLTAGK